MSLEAHWRVRIVSLDSEKHTLQIYQIKIAHEKNISFSHSIKVVVVLSSLGRNKWIDSNTSISVGIHVLLSLTTVKISLNTVHSCKQITF